MTEYTIFHIEGGVGKHIAASAVLECYKKAHPHTKIVVVCAWPEVYLTNPHIYRVYRIGHTPYFYQDFVYNKSVTIHAQEPYKTTTHITKQKHLIESWCDLVKVPYSGETPRLYYNYREMELGMKLIPKSEKPILLFQPFGGPGKDHQGAPYSWMRDIHPDIAQEIVNRLKDRYNIIHLCLDYHPQLNNCHRLDQIMQKKIMFNLLAVSSARILVDSCVQHAAAAMNLPSTVVWVGTHPQVFGYSLHNNIGSKTAFPEGTVDSYLYDYNFTGNTHECPYRSPYEIFDVDRIVHGL